MIKIRNIRLENGISGEELAALVLEATGINPKKKVELMECRSNPFRVGYIDLYYRINYTSDLLLLRCIGSDASLMSIVFKRGFFKNRKRFLARCERLAKKYRKCGISYDFVCAFSDSEGVIYSFINKMKKIHMKEEFKKKLLDSDTECKRKLVEKCIGSNLAKRAKLETKDPNHIDIVATFIATKY